MFRRLIIPLVLLSTVSAETLQQALTRCHIPTTAFTATELKQNVVAAWTSESGLLAYQIFLSPTTAEPLQLVRFDPRTGKTSRKKVTELLNDVCDSGLGSLTKLDEFLLLTTSISPSAECTMVFDPDLRLSQILYGFGAVRIGPAQIVLIENMIHFAPVHPERLQFADLASKRTAELYPPKDDALRLSLSRELAGHMPPKDQCMKNNDPCDPNLFDEDVRDLTSDEKGRFAFIANQSGSRLLVEEQPPVAIASQSVLYLYQRNAAGWNYCEQRINEAELKGLGTDLKSNFDEVFTRCVPNLAVVPNMGTATYNPFMNNSLTNPKSHN